MSDTNTRLFRARKFLLPIAAACGLAIFLAYRLLFPPFTPAPLPQPNGYDDLLRAAEMLAPRTGFYGEMDDEELAALVAQNESALEISRQALQKECAVPLDWSENGQWVDQEYFKKGSKMRSLARAFAADGLWAANQGEIDRAVQCGFDKLRLGRAASHGGLNVDWMVGHAIGYLGLHTLRSQLDRCSEEQCRQIKETLKDFDPYLESPEQVLRRERAYYRHTNPGLISLIQQFQLRAQAEQLQQYMFESEQRYSVLRNLLRVHLSIRRHELAEGRLPEKLRDLVPGYLEQVPLDPYTEDELTYALEGDEYLLYSVGPNRIDDGGVETTDGKNGDLLLLPTEASR